MEKFDPGFLNRALETIGTERNDHPQGNSREGEQRHADVIVTVLELGHDEGSLSHVLLRVCSLGIYIIRGSSDASTGFESRIDGHPFTLSEAAVLLW